MLKKLVCFKSGKEVSLGATNAEVSITTIWLIAAALESAWYKAPTGQEPAFSVKAKSAQYMRTRFDLDYQKNSQYSIIPLIKPHDFFAIAQAHEAKGEVFADMPTYSGFNGHIGVAGYAHVETVLNTFTCWHNGYPDRNFTFSPTTIKSLCKRLYETDIPARMANLTDGAKRATQVFNFLLNWNPIKDGMICFSA